MTAAQIVEAISDSAVCSLDSTHKMIKPNSVVRLMMCHAPGFVQHLVTVCVRREAGDFVQDGRVSVVTFPVVCVVLCPPRPPPPRRARGQP